MSTNFENKNIIWIFIEDEGDVIDSRLPFKIFSNLLAAKKKPYQGQSKKVTHFYQTDFDENISSSQLYRFSSILEAMVNYLK